MSDNYIVTLNFKFLFNVDIIFIAQIGLIFLKYFYTIKLKPDDSTAPIFRV